MSRMLTLVAAMLIMASCGEAKMRSASEWVGRRIYQVLTDRFATTNAVQGKNLGDWNQYQGGNYQGMIDKLDYIQGMGFNAIWISPILTNLESDGKTAGYHGYWATNFFDTNPHFGSQDDLKDFVSECHKRDIWVMLDIVINHSGPIGTDYGQVQPFNSAEHYHDRCDVKNYQCMTDEVYNCRLADLPDLNQDNQYVMDQLKKSLNWQMTTFDFDGIRADTVMYLRPDQWASVWGSLNNVMITGEVFSDFGCNQQYLQQNALPSTLNYPLYYALRDVFGSHHGMQDLGNAWRQQTSLPNPDWEVNFVDNHDIDRFLNSGAGATNFKSAIAYAYFTNGIPSVYYGSEQLMGGSSGDNSNRASLWNNGGYNTDSDMYKFLKNLNEMYASMNVASGSASTKVEELYADDSFYCVSRPGAPAVMCATNNGGQQKRTVNNLPFEGKKVCVMGQSDCFDGKSSMEININDGQSPYIMYVQ